MLRMGEYDSNAYTHAGTSKMVGHYCQLDLTQPQVNAAVGDLETP